jgi:hypothetical protein
MGLVFNEDKWDKTLDRLLMQSRKKGHKKWDLIEKIYLLCKSAYQWYLANGEEEEADSIENFYQTTIESPLILDGSDFSQRLLGFSITIPFTDIEKNTLQDLKYNQFFTESQKNGKYKNKTNRDRGEVEKKLKCKVSRLQGNLESIYLLNEKETKKNFNKYLRKK